MSRIDDCHDCCKDPRWADRKLRTNAMNERHILYIRANQQSVRGRVSKRGNQPERKGCDFNLRVPCSRNTHVGKKLTKLSPNNWEAHMTMKIRTLGSLSANFKPSKMLQTQSTFSLLRDMGLHTSLARNPGQPRQHLPQAEFVPNVSRRESTIWCCVAAKEEQKFRPSSTYLPTLGLART